MAVFTTCDKMHESKLEYLVKSVVDQSHELISDLIHLQMMKITVTVIKYNVISHLFAQKEGEEGLETVKQISK